MTIQELKDFINNLPKNIDLNSKIYIFDPDSNIYDSTGISIFSGIWDNKKRVCIKFE